MIYLVTGGSGSGKSEYAESLAVAAGGERLYLATMMVWDEEGRRRVERHRNMRADKGFVTVERYCDLASLRLEGHPVVLLECMSNLVSNEFYRLGCEAEAAAEAAERGILSLSRQCRILVIVTNDVFSDGESYGEETLEYIRALGEVNRFLGSLADRAVEVICGIPVVLKGDERGSGGDTQFPVDSGQTIDQGGR